MIRKLTIVTTVSIMTARIGVRRRMRPHLKVAVHLCHGSRSRSETERIMAEIDMRKSRDEVQLHAQEDLHRALKDRHVQMIAIGGTIGVGLFLGSATAIQKAGPGLVVSYAIGGLVMFFIMRALGELLLYRPVSGSFATYAEEFVGPWAGFVTGWSYWFLWVTVGIAELTAVGIYMQYWLPDLPQWIPVLAMLALLLTVNLLNVKFFGEFEF